MIAVIGVIYGTVFFFDCFFKSCMHYPYDAFLRNTGLTVQFMRLRWHTTAFNRTIFKWGSSCSKIFIHAFNLGVITSIVLMALGILILSASLFGTSSGGGSDVTSKKFEVQMELLLPGVNLPLSEIGYYITALLICSVVHELGHAIAAVMEDVPVTGFGIYVLFCFPVAYTELSTEHLNALKPLRKLRVLCAGIWHNVVLAAVFYVIFIGLGPALTPFYQTNSAVVITHISPNSHLRGDRGLYWHDVIQSINECKVRNLDTWYSCLVKTLHSKPAFCVSSEFIRLNDETGLTAHIDDGLVQCCDPSNTKVLCFEYINDISNDDPLEIPQHMCLDIRKTVEEATSLCTTTCDEGFCIRPVINNSTTLLTIARKDRERVIYIGHPSDLYRTIKLSEFVPKTSFLTPEFADSLSLFLKYNVVFSLGLAVINAIPSFSLDGHHISSTIINSILANKITERARRELVLLAVSCLGTLLFLSSIIKVLWSSLVTRFM